jgi:hypothetical protein
MFEATLNDLQNPFKVLLNAMKIVSLKITAIQLQDELTQQQQMLP